MELIDFPGRNVIFAENQPECMPLPAHRDLQDPQGLITCCWRLSWRERLRVLLRGEIWHQVLTFHAPLQPQLLTVERPGEVPAK